MTDPNDSPTPVPVEAEAEAPTARRSQLAERAQLLFAATQKATLPDMGLKGWLRVRRNPPSSRARRQSGRETPCISTTPARATAF
jgi:hypothetical protein